MKFSINILTQAICLVGSVSQTVIAAGKYRDDVHVLMYETDASLEGQANSPLHFFKKRSEVANLKTTVYGNNLEYRGFGDKYTQLRPLLEIINQDTLVVLADARDVALNIPQDEDMAMAAVDYFVANFNRATEKSPNAVVLSAEAQCCVSAMSHAHPSEYFDTATGKRKKRACSSGTSGCLWSENDNIRSWVGFMHERATKETGLADAGDVYLNAGLMAGKPKDLLKLLDLMDIAPQEDDQAVLTGLMYSYPEMIILDYGQEMFGNNQWTVGPEEGCVFEGFGPESALTHIDTKTQPLMIHTPGKFYACLDLLIEALGGESQKRYNPTIRRILTGRLSLAAQLGYGGSATAKAVKVEETKKEVTPSPTETVTSATVEEVEPANNKIADTAGEEPMNYGMSSTAAEEPTNYGMANYGMANYGISSTAAKEPTNYGMANYGISSTAAEEPTNYGMANYGISSTAAEEPTNYGMANYGISSTAVEEPTNYGVANYGISSTAGEEEDVTNNYGNYGQYGVVSESNYGISRDGNYGQYGDAAINYGQYGNYGNYGQFGGKLLRRRRRRRVITTSN